MDKINGVIVTEANNNLSKEDILIKLLEIYKIDNILNIEIESKYFDMPNKTGEYILDIKRDENELFRCLIIVNDNNNLNVENNNNTFLISIIVITILIIVISISMLISKLRIKKKKNDFFKNQE